MKTEYSPAPVCESGFEVSIPRAAGSVSFWQQWLHHPERIRLRQALFQIHLWTGAATGLYVLMMSLTGTVLVFHNELAQRFSLEWLVRLHTNLLAGHIGRLINGIGAICLSVVCLTGIAIWWPGVKNWRRGLTVNWRSRFARINWDAHSALGFWLFFFPLIWGVSGVYFSFPEMFNSLSEVIDPRNRYGQSVLAMLADLHFGRFNIFTELLWAAAGLVPAVLALTGVFLCCKRLIDAGHGSNGPARLVESEMPRRARRPVS